MIKNQRQYRITKAQAEKFAAALHGVASKPGKNTLLRELEMRALASQLDELQDQIREFERLQSGSESVIHAESFEELPRALVRARIALRLSQKQLAQRLGLKEQQIQRYEASNYRAASIARMQKIVRALGIHIREEIFLPSPIGAPRRKNHRR
jgi:DNA-binding XRE family transcriptional regulator